MGDHWLVVDLGVDGDGARHRHGVNLAFTYLGKSANSAEKIDSNSARFETVTVGTEA